MHIGLIGGIGPAATDFYYRSLITLAAQKNRALDLTIVHADAPTLLAHLAADDQTAQCAIYDRLTERLARAGAECMAITSIAGHFCVDRFSETAALPVINLPQALQNWLKTQGLNRVGILGTQTVMASAMYGKLAPVECLAPEGTELERVHEAYVTLAQSGVSSPELQAVFFAAGRALMARGAEAVLLGGTDLNPAFAGADCGFPIVDCADIHIQEIAQRI